MNLVESKPTSLNEVIFDNKLNILENINTYILNNDMNIILLGIIPNQFIRLLVDKYYSDKYNIDTPNDHVLDVDCFSDLNISSDNNDIIIFSKSKTHYKKFVIIYNLEQINDNIQVYFKNIMNPSTFFIFCSDSIQKVYETILTRCKHIQFHPLKHIHYMEIINDLCKQENILLEETDKDFLISHSNVDYIYHIFNHFKLLNKNIIEAGTITNYIHYIQNNKFDEYINHIKNNELTNAFDILFYYYDKGFSLLDIYYFMYEYIKINTPSQLNYDIIEILCAYINNIYEGFDTKLCLVFLTNDIKLKI